MVRVFIVLVVLAGCNAPGLGFRGAPMTRVIVEGSVYDVRVVGNQAEAIRINEEYAPRLGPLGGRALVAIEYVSGCTARKAAGDAAVVTAYLQCPGQDQPPIAPWRGSYNRTVECLEIGSYVSGATQELITDYDCAWVS